MAQKTIESETVPVVQDIIDLNVSTFYQYKWPPYESDEFVRTTREILVPPRFQTPSKILNMLFGFEDTTEPVILRRYKRSDWVEIIASDRAISFIDKELKKRSQGNKVH